MIYPHPSLPTLTLVYVHLPHHVLLHNFYQRRPVV